MNNLGEGDGKATSPLPHGHLPLLLRQPGGAGGLHEAVHQQGSDEEPPIIMDRTVRRRQQANIFKLISLNIINILKIKLLQCTKCKQF